MTFANIQNEKATFFVLALGFLVYKYIFYYAKDIIAIIIIMESAAYDRDSRAYVRREGNGSFKKVRHSAIIQ